jgi:hypothetical protein
MWDEAWDLRGLDELRDGSSRRPDVCDLLPGSGARFRVRAPIQSDSECSDTNYAPPVSRKRLRAFAVVVNHETHLEWMPIVI